MKTWIVETHIGAFETTAESAEKAISNIRFRMFGRSPAGRRFAANWTAKEA
jgi:hypothetical protein